MAKIIEDFFDRLTYGKGAHRNKVTITDEFTGAVDEFYILSEKYNLEDIKDSIQGSHAGNPKDVEYSSYAVRYVEFILFDPIPDLDQQKLVYYALRDKYIREVTGLAERYKNPKRWDQARMRFDKAIPRHIERIFDTGLIIED